MEFCKAFNAATQAQAAESLIIPVVISIYSDRTFTFITKTPPMAVLIKKSAKIAKGSSTPNREKVGKITRQEAEKIAQTKMKDLNAKDLNGAVKMVIGTARSMGVEVEEA
jgi:large subunit ribosomal protein L11